MCLIFWLCSSSIFSQNKAKKTIDAKGISVIEINGNQIFNIQVEATSTTTISYEAMVDGDYQNEFQVIATSSKSRLTLDLTKMSYNQIRDDKRNAHKVVAAGLRLKIPQQLDLQVISDIGSLELSGSFKSVKVNLSQGYFKMQGTAKQGEVFTIDGDILLETKNSEISADATHGQVSIVDFKTTLDHWILKSINGNIMVTEQQN